MMATPIALGESNPIAQRRAVESNGRVGSFYDGWQDQILENYRIDLNFTSVPRSSSVTCYMKGCLVNGETNLLKTHNLHDELRLSIVLQMIPALGVGALINYSRPIDKYTRLLRYRLFSRSEYLPDDEIRSLCRDKTLIADNIATHVIVSVNWGIDVAIVLQLPSDDELVKALEYCIEKLCIILRGEASYSTLSPEDMDHLGKIVHTEVFSNIPALRDIRSIMDLYHDIGQIKKDVKLYQPYNYHLYPVQEFFIVKNDKQITFHELQKQQVKKVETYLLRLLKDRNTIARAVEQSYPNVQRHLKEKLNEIRSQWAALKSMHSDQISCFQEVIIGIRHGNHKEELVDEVLENDNTKKLNKLINELTNQLNDIEKKENFINDLNGKQFKYRHAIAYGITSVDDEQLIQSKFSEVTQNTRIVCFNDTLYQQNKAQWYSLQGMLIKERDDNSQIEIIYVDFSYCNSKLNHIITLPPLTKTDSMNTQTTQTTQSEKSFINNEFINILLLGESGAGKSTFINAFVNYLKFEKLEDARKKPIVLIPVSFIMTEGDNFVERQVTFGGIDTLTNEDFTHSGQSVTQHCKSYIFTLDDRDYNGKKLRIIDTPGIGDVRGSNQDDINMQHILSFINNLTHLNAVCILMKPNNARLNVFFRSCLIQLFDLLGKDAENKIIFCFTNARSTFYTPGNTGPLLKQLLDSLPGQEVSFAKKNTFCFDSESFRYLVAVENKITFTDLNVEEYKDSWNKSSIESKRFIDYIFNHMKTSLIIGERKSIKGAQLRINLMVRPMLETIRNILRNKVLYNSDFQSVSIELKPRIIKCTTAICLKCRHKPLQCHQFWILPDELHVFHNKCRSCPCNPDDHYSIDYQLEYKECNRSSNQSDQEMTHIINDLSETGAEFVQFLITNSNSLQSDLFLADMDRMIKEEQSICQSQTSCDLNKKLLNCLQQQKSYYEEMRHKLSSDKVHFEFAAIYEKIEKITSHPIIKAQMNAVAEWHSFMVQYYEHKVKSM